MIGAQPAGLVVRPIGADDWREFRALRLRMLADTPIAFEERLEVAERVGEDRWRERAGRTGGFVRFAAIAGDGRWLGTMGGVLGDARSDQAILVAAYVEPDARGAGGVTDALFDAVTAWALPQRPRLALFVHEHNARARRAYEKRGFALTGRSVPYPLAPRERELEMERMLREP